MPPGYLNRHITAWTKETLADLKGNVSSMGIVDTRKLLTTLRSRHSLRDNDIWKTAFIMPLRGIMAEHGAAGSGFSAGRKIGPATNREPRPWFSNAMNVRFPKLADTLQHEVGNYVQREVAALPLPGEKSGMNNYRVSINL